MKLLEKKTITESAADAIRDYILSNGLKEGDSLPSEQAFSERLGISRNIIREAMRQFREAGIIVSKPKTGARIKSLKPSDPYHPFMPFLEKNERSLKELAQVRTALEIGSVPYIFAGKTPEKMAELEDACTQFEKAKSIRGKIEAEKAFHTCLLRFPENNLLESLLPLLIDFFDCKICQEDRKRSQKTVCTEHRKIVKALQKQDQTALLKAVTDHAAHYLTETKKEKSKCTI